LAKASLSTRSLMPDNDDRKLEDSYEVSPKILGEGAFGHVKLCKHKKSGTQRVVKFMKLSEIPDQNALLTELSIQAQLDHPNICRVYEYFVTEDFISLVMEMCCGGDLSDAICERGTFLEADAQNFMLQVLLAVNYMHSRNIVHRDLKPENFLLIKDDNWGESTVKVVDFGFAREFEPGTSNMKTVCGTPHYLAPEILEGDGYSEKCDMWSLGVILYYFLSGDVPFDGEDLHEIVEATRKSISFDDAVWRGVSPNGKLACTQLLKRDPSQRFTAFQFMKTPWFEMPVKERRQGVSRISAEVVVKRMKRFKTWGQFQREAAHLVAHNLPEKEQEELRAVFQNMDKNKDGKLTLDELKEGCDGVCKVDDVETLFKSMDTDDSGYVEWTEFLAALASQKMLSREEACRHAFEVLDKDRNGYLTVEEVLETMGKSVKGPMEEELRKEFDKIDKNGDKKISFDEFRQLMLDVLVIAASPRKASKGQYSSESDKASELASRLQSCACRIESLDLDDSDDAKKNGDDEKQKKNCPNCA